MDITISSENSGALQESPLKTNPVLVELVPAKENLVKIDSNPASLKTTQAEEPRVPESTKTNSSMEIEQLDRPDISPPKESQIQPKEAVTEPASLPQETEETKSSSSRSSGRTKRQTRFFGRPLRHVVKIVEEAGTSAARTTVIPPSEELYTALRAVSISSGSFPLSDEEQTVVGRKISATKSREPILKLKLKPKNK